MSFQLALINTVTVIFLFFFMYHVASQFYTNFQENCLLRANKGNLFNLGFYIYSSHQRNTNYFLNEGEYFSDENRTQKVHLSFDHVHDTKFTMSIVGFEMFSVWWKPRLFLSFQIEQIFCQPYSMNALLRLFTKRSQTHNLNNTESSYYYALHNWNPNHPIVLPSKLHQTSDNTKINV